MFLLTLLELNLSYFDEIIQFVIACSGRRRRMTNARAITAKPLGSHIISGILIQSEGTATGFSNSLKRTPMASIDPD
jgi:hypothetical protein